MVNWHWLGMASAHGHATQCSILAQPWQNTYYFLSLWKGSRPSPTGLAFIGGILSKKSLTLTSVSRAQSAGPATPFLWLRMAGYCWWKPMGLDPGWLRKCSGGICFAWCWLWCCTQPALGMARVHDLCQWEGHLGMTSMSLSMPCGGTPLCPMSVALVALLCWA